MSNTDIIFYTSHMYTIVIYDTSVKYRYYVFIEQVRDIL